MKKVLSLVTPCFPGNAPERAGSSQLLHPRTRRSGLRSVSDSAAAPLLGTFSGDSGRGLRGQQEAEAQAPLSFHADAGPLVLLLPLHVVLVWGSGVLSVQNWKLPDSGSLRDRHSVTPRIVFQFCICLFQPRFKGRRLHRGANTRGLSPPGPPMEQTHMALSLASRWLLVIESMYILISDRGTARLRAVAVCTAPSVEMKCFRLTDVPWLFFPQSFASSQLQL